MVPCRSWPCAVHAGSLKQKASYSKLSLHFRLKYTPLTGFCEKTDISLMNRNDSCAAQMSVVLVTPDSYENIRKTMEHLRAQTVPDQLEIVIVAPSLRALNFNISEFTLLCRYQVEEDGYIR